MVRGHAQTAVLPEDGMGISVRVALLLLGNGYYYLNYYSLMSFLLLLLLFQIAVKDGWLTSRERIHFPSDMNFLEIGE